MNSIESAIREILAEGVDDWVPVDRIIGLAREIAVAEAGKFQSFAVRMIESLIGQGLMEVGEIGDSGFEQWNGDPGVLVARVIAICESFNWEPFGEACWLANTKKGNAWVQE